MRQNRLDATTKIVFDKVKNIDEKWAKPIAIMGVTIIAFAFLYSVFIRRDMVIQPLFYLNDKNDFKFVTIDNVDPSKITETVDLKNISYMHESNKKVIYSLGGAAFLLDTASGKSTPLNGSVKQHLFNTNDKYAVYLTQTGELKTYDFYDHRLIAENVTTVVAAADNYILYYKNNDLYFSSLDKRDEILINNNVDDVKLNAKKTEILYRVKKDDTYSYHVYKFKNKENKEMLTNVDTLYSYDDGFTNFIYQVKNEKNGLVSSDILNDPYLEADKLFVEYTVDLVLTGQITVEEYQKNRQEKEAISKRNIYREDIVKYLESLQTYTIYYKNTVSNTVIVNDAANVYLTNISGPLLVYGKYSKTTKINIDEITSTSMLEERVANHTLDIIYNKKIGNDKTLVTDAKNDIKFYIIDNKDIYYISNHNLYYLPLKDEEALEAVLIDEKVLLANQYKFNSHLIYFKEETNSLWKVKESTKELIAENVATIKNVDEAKKSIVYTDKDNKLWLHYKTNIKIADNVRDVKYVHNNLIYYLVSNNERFDLYRYVGNNKTELIEKNVKEICH